MVRVENEPRGPRTADWDFPYPRAIRRGTGTRSLGSGGKETGVKDSGIDPTTRSLESRPFDLPRVYDPTYTVYPHVLPPGPVD